MINETCARVSPDDFYTHLNSINAAPTQAGRQGLAASADMPPVSKGTIRDVGLEINRILRAHASKSEFSRHQYCRVAVPPRARTMYTNRENGQRLESPK